MRGWVFERFGFLGFMGKMKKNEYEKNLREGW